MSSYSIEAIASFKHALQQEANNWDDGLELGEPANGAAAAYANAGRHLARLVRPQVSHEVAGSMVFDSALLVTSLFIHKVAALGHEAGFDADTLREAAVGRDSVATLLLPAQLPLRSCRAIENTLGMRHVSNNTPSQQLSHYTLSEQGAAIRDIDALFDDANRYRHPSEQIYPEERLAGRCPAPALGLIRSTLDAMTTIAAQDTRLFATTLEQGIIE